MYICARLTSNIVLYGSQEPIERYIANINRNTAHIHNGVYTARYIINHVNAFETKQELDAHMEEIRKNFLGNAEVLMIYVEAGRMRVV